MIYGLFAWLAVLIFRSEVCVYYRRQNDYTFFYLTDTKTVSVKYLFFANF